MDAETARKKAEAIEVEKSATQLGSVQAKIDKVSDSGGFEIQWEGDLYPRVLRILKSDGYTVTRVRSKSYDVGNYAATEGYDGYKISW